MKEMKTTTKQVELTKESILAIEKFLKLVNEFNAEKLAEELLTLDEKLRELEKNSENLQEKNSNANEQELNLKLRQYLKLTKKYCFTYSSFDEEMNPGDYKLEINAKILKNKFTHSVHVNNEEITIEELRNGIKTFLML